MIVTDHNTRLSAEEVLEHEWFDILKDQSTQGETSGSSKNVLESLRNFKCNSELKKTCLHMLAKMIKRKDLKELKHEFELIDGSQDGYLSFNELKQALEKCEINISDSEVKDIISRSGFSNKNAINYTEFLVMTLDHSKVTTEEAVNSLIQNFDRENKGHITKEDIQNELFKNGKKLSRTQLREIMKMHDPSKKGYITYTEFKDMLFQN